MSIHIAADFPTEVRKERRFEEAAPLSSVSLISQPHTRKLAEALPQTLCFRGWKLEVLSQPSSSFLAAEA